MVIRALTQYEIWDCDWDESDCPVCGREQGKHTEAQITHCAQVLIQGESQ